MTTPYASEAFLHQLLGKALAAQASDIHLKVGKPPGARVRGDLVYFRVDRIKPEDTEALCRMLLGVPAGRPPLDEQEERALAYQVPGLGRFRVTLFRQRGALSVVMRSIPLKVPTPADLGVPASVVGLVDAAPGLVVVAGGAAEGKTTTLAALIGKVNEALPRQVITVEDPIEFLHEDGKASVCQREVGADVESLAAGLRGALRQDADLVMVDGLGAPGTIEAAIEVAEAGRLVLASMNATDVGSAIARLLAGQGSLGTEARERVLTSLRAVVAQKLVMRKDGLGLALASEVLVVSPALRTALLRPGERSVSAIVAEALAQGGTTFAAELGRLASEGTIPGPSAAR
ncbi:MAG: ATPase, T2SS/T4P/T4SS family [Byssovorax sp.]